MYSSGSFKLLVLLAITYSNAAAPLKSNLVQFYPISQEQYDSILRMTAGRPVISEGRLINSGIRSINELRSSLSDDVSSGLRQILNITGFLPASAKASTEKVDGYPLCVIKTTEADYTDDEDDEDDTEVDSTLSQARAESVENAASTEEGRPIVNCIVVVKSKVHEKQEDNVQQPLSRTTVQNRMVPLYYPPFLAPYEVYPAYRPFYNYPYFTEPRQNAAPNTIRRPVTKTAHIRHKSAGMLRSSSAKDISAETPSKVASTGRSGYSNYYPYNYGNYGNYGNYYQQGYPYGSNYGGCQSYPYNYYGRNGDEDGDGDDGESGEERSNSGEVDGEIGGEVGGHEY